MTPNQNNSHKQGECSEIEMDLTDYVMGDMTFLTKEKQQNLFKHLMECAKCRKDFMDWEKVFGVLVAEQHLAKPEVKKRMDDLLKQFHKETKKPGSKIIAPDKDLMI